MTPAAVADTPVKLRLKLVTISSGKASVLTGGFAPAFGAFVAAFGAAPDEAAEASVDEPEPSALPDPSESVVHADTSNAAANKLTILIRIYLPLGRNM